MTARVVRNPVSAAYGRPPETADKDAEAALSRGLCGMPSGRALNRGVPAPTVPKGGLGGETDRFAGLHAGAEAAEGAVLELADALAG